MTNQYVFIFSYCLHPIVYHSNNLCCQLKIAIFKEVHGDYQDRCNEDSLSVGCISTATALGEYHLKRNTSQNNSMITELGKIQQQNNSIKQQNNSITKYLESIVERLNMQPGKSLGALGNQLNHEDELKDENYKLFPHTFAGAIVEDLSVDKYWEVKESKNNIRHICCLYGCSFLCLGKKLFHVPILVDISAASDVKTQSESITRFYQKDCKLDSICFIASDGSKFFGVKLTKQSALEGIKLRIETNFEVTDQADGLSPKAQLIAIASSVGHTFFGDQVRVPKQIAVDDDDEVSDQTEQLLAALFFTCGVLKEDPKNPHFLIPPKKLHKFFRAVKSKSKTFPDDMTIEHLLCQMMLSNMLVYYQVKGKIHDTSYNIWKKLQSANQQYHIPGLFNGLFQFLLLS